MANGKESSLREATTSALGDSSFTREEWEAEGQLAPSRSEARYEGVSHVQDVPLGYASDGA